MDRRNICVFDFETGSGNPYKCEILQIAAVMLHRNTLKTVSKFQSLMKPEDFDALEAKALQVNGLTVEQLQEAPEASVVFPEFCTWIQRYNFTTDNNFFGCPVPCGYNISGFDLHIFDRYCKKYGFWDENQNRQKLFWPLNRFDVFDHLWLYCRRNTDLKKMKLTSVLEYCGVPAKEIEENAHNAIWDVEWTAKLAVKLLNLAGYLTAIDETTGQRRLDIANCFKG